MQAAFPNKILSVTLNQTVDIRRIQNAASLLFYKVDDHVKHLNRLIEYKNTVKIILITLSEALILLNYMLLNLVITFHNQRFCSITRMFHASHILVSWNVEIAFQNLFFVWWEVWELTSLHLKNDLFVSWIETCKFHKC